MASRTAARLGLGTLLIALGALYVAGAMRHGAQVNVIDPAFLPLRPLPPGRTTVALIFLLASLVLGTLIALLRAATDERLFAAADAAGLTHVLVEVPRAMKRRAHAAI